MTELWTPPANPPQVSNEARAKLTHEFITKGIVEPSLNAHWSLQDSEKQLGNYILQLGSEMHQSQPKIPWHTNVLMVGAGIAWGAYRETGYYQEISEYFAVAELMAEVNGIPDSYICSLADDQNLMSLIDDSLAEGNNMVLQMPDLKHVLSIGAGCVRYFFEQALETA